MISIVIPLYNKEQCIAETIHSVLFQSFEDFEVVIVDDGSTDNSVSVVKQIADDRIKMFKQTNMGPSSARNRGVRESKFDWILFLDADDLLVQGSLSHFVDLIHAHPDIQCFCSNHYIRNGGQDILYSNCYKNGIIKNNFLAWAFHRCGLRAGAGLFNRALLLKNPFDETLRRYEDSEVLFRILPYIKIYRTDFPTVIYNCETVGASVDYNNFSEDFLSHLDLHHKSLSEKIVMYQLFYQANRDYPVLARHKYWNFFYRYDLRIICRLIAIIVEKSERIAMK